MRKEEFPEHKPQNQKTYGGGRKNKKGSLPASPNPDNSGKEGGYGRSSCAKHWEANDGVVEKRFSSLLFQHGNDKRARC